MSSAALGILTLIATCPEQLRAKINEQLELLTYRYVRPLFSERKWSVGYARLWKSRDAKISIASSDSCHGRTSLLLLKVKVKFIYWHVLLFIAVEFTQQSFLTESY